jgi:phenylacetate-CoA ligase
MLTLDAWHDVDELRTIQDGQLERTLRWAAASPFYRRRLAGTFPGGRSAFADTPLTTKRDLREAYPFGLLAVSMRRLATYHESSGTSGEPTASYYTEDDWDDLAERYARP